MPDFPIVDSHVHLCDPQRFGYAWMKNVPQLNRAVLPSHLTKAAAPFEIDQFVFVEVDVDFPQHLGEAAWVQRTVALRRANDRHGRGAAAGKGKSGGARA